MHNIKFFFGWLYDFFSIALGLIVSHIEFTILTVLFPFWNDPWNRWSLLDLYRAENGLERMELSSIKFCLGLFIWNTLEQWSLQLILRTKSRSHISVRRTNYIMGCCILLIFPAGESKKNLCLFLIWFSFEFHQNLIDLSLANYRYPLQIFVSKFEQKPRWKHNYTSHNLENYHYYYYY